MSSTQPATSLRIATEIKNKGTDAFKAADIKTAQTKYQKALRYLDSATITTRDLALEDQLSALRLSLLLNSALMALKSSAPLAGPDARLAIKQASAALDLDGDAEKSADYRKLADGEKAKALYRRAVGHVAIKEEENAIKDLEQALKLAPQDGAISKE